MKKFSLGTLFGFILSITLVVCANTLFGASDIEFKSKDSSWKASSVQEAIEDLYDLHGKFILEYNYKGSGNEPKEFPTTPKGYSVGHVECDGAEAEWDNVKWYLIIKRMHGNSIKCTADLYDAEINTKYNFAYTGSYQEWVAPADGDYLFEAWGASGGSVTYSNGGLGAYTSGEIHLEQGTRMYVYVGEYNNSNTGSFNGGGAGATGSGTGKSGGGATDFRYLGNDLKSNSELAWDNEIGLRNRIMVAGGGGGAAIWSAASNGTTAGQAGGLTGYQGGYTLGSGTIGAVTRYAQGGTQTSGGAQFLSTAGAQYHGENGLFGKAGSSAGKSYGGGGGGGWYGGASGGASNNIVTQGGGGSSYISGHDGCIGVTSTGSVSNTSVSHTNFKFTNTIMIDGTGYKWTNTKFEYVQMKNPTTNALMVGNNGAGYARITLISID